MLDRKSNFIGELPIKKTWAPAEANIKIIGVIHDSQMAIFSSFFDSFFSKAGQSKGIPWLRERSNRVRHVPWIPLPLQALCHVEGGTVFPWDSCGFTFVRPSMICFPRFLVGLFFRQSARKLTPKILDNAGGALMRSPSSDPQYYRDMALCCVVFACSQVPLMGKIANNFRPNAKFPMTSASIRGPAVCMRLQKKAPETRPNKCLGL